ncbi:16S rRNA (uracil(1498)-N(3))-methyltransferase, partial [bacterium]|nr:16S rRNA (uracil(1498)-N(3))-methyltransferase [bacterium]
MTTGEQVFLSTLERGQTNLTLTDSEYHHLIRVRRFLEGQEIWVVNGLGLAALARIQKIQSNALELEIVSFEENRGELDTELILALANLKGDHLDLVVEKSTELGVHQIFPLITDHTIKKGINQNRLQRIAITAMKQSRRSRLTEIHKLMTFTDFAQAHKNETHLFCYSIESALPLLESKHLFQDSKQVVIWIGPEGDWSKDEIDL